MNGEEGTTTAEAVPTTAAAMPERRAGLRTVVRGPLGALGLISLLSALLRIVGLGQPAAPMFDEAFYVNAARDIVGLHDVTSRFPYHPGLDPTPEHPALAKLLIGGSMKILGDTPVAWRLPGVVFGSLAILLMYWLVRSAGGRPWMAVTAAALMAVDNLLFVHSRMATLDIFVLVFMLATAGLYLRRKWAWAGVALGVGMCTKLVAADLLVVLALVELGRLVARRRFPDRHPSPALRRVALELGGCAAIAAAVYLALLSGLDLFTTTYRNPVAHTLDMLRMVSHPAMVAPGVPPSPVSAPWEWLYDRVPIPYFLQQVGDTTLVDFRGLIAPPIAYAVVPSMAVAAWAWWRDPDETALFALSWFLGTMGPFVLGAVGGRATYLYYMVVVLPAVYLAIARWAFLRPRAPATLRAIYVVALGLSFVAFFPLRSWSVIRPW